MIPFFRKIRKKMADDNRPLKYMRYAVGEIVLVVIGILIALQINNWNEERRNRLKEKSYLMEIRKNLINDTIRINEIHEFNLRKDTVVRYVFRVFEKASSENPDLLSFEDNMDIMGSYDSFSPSRTAFDNLMDVESLDIISDLPMRIMLSNYYNTDFEKGTQEAVKLRTRKFAEYAIKYLITKESVFEMTQVTLKIKSRNNSKIYEDEIIIGSLINMMVTTGFQNRILENTKDQIKEILVLLNEVNSTNQ